MIAIGKPARDGTSATSGVSTKIDDDADDDRARNRKNGDRGVLTPNESDRALIDRARHVAHRVCACVAP